MKSQNLRQQGIHCRPLVWTAATGSTCRRNSCINDGNTKSKSLPCAGGQPGLAGSCRIPLHQQSGSSQASSTELCTTGDMSLRPTAGQATTTSMTLKLTQQYQRMTMTLSP